jgi:hypothetical protein
MIQRTNTNSNWKPSAARAKPYRGRIIGISPPFPDRGLRPCPSCDQGKIVVNNAIANCPACEGTGKQMTEKILITYQIDKPDKSGLPTTQLKEHVTNSLFAGATLGPDSNEPGKVLSASTWHKRLSALYGLAPNTKLEATDIDPYDDLSQGLLPELVLLVDGYKVFDMRLYEGDNDRIHAQMPVERVQSPVAASNPPVQPPAPKPRLRPAGSAVVQVNSLPGLTVPVTQLPTIPYPVLGQNAGNQISEDAEEDVPF